MEFQAEKERTNPHYISKSSIHIQDLGADDAKISSTDYRCSTLRSCRWILAYVCFGGMFLVFGMRSSFVMTLVCLFPEEPNAETQPELNEGHEYKLSHNTSDAEVQNQLGLNGTNISCNETVIVMWDDKIQGLALSAYNYGFVISPIIGGYIATHSAKYLLLASMFVSTVATFLMPWSIGTNAYFAISLRIVVGICGGVCVPAIQDLWSKWAPKEERGKLTAFTHSGKMVGRVLTFSLSGVFCTVRFLGGWPIIFYGMGVLSVIWMILAIFLVYDSPQKHPRITEEEKEYILKGTTCRTKTDEKKSKTNTPWIKICMSVPVWACLICKLSSSYGLAVQMTNMPMWVRDVLKFEIRENGVYSALPYVGQFVGSLLAGIILDALHRIPFPVTVVRKLTFTLCLLLPGSAIFSLSFLDCRHSAIAICLTVVASTTYAAVPVSLRIVILEMAPKYAGILMGMAVTVGTIPGMVAPFITSVLTSRGTAGEWNKVFYMCGGFYALAAVVFLIFGSAKEQPWANDKLDQEMIIKPEDKADLVDFANKEIHINKGETFEKAQPRTQGISTLEIANVADSKTHIGGVYNRGFQEELATSDTSTDSGVWVALKMKEIKSLENDTVYVEPNSSDDTNRTINGISNLYFLGEEMESGLWKDHTEPGIQRVVRLPDILENLAKCRVPIDIQTRDRDPPELSMNAIVRDEETLPQIDDTVVSVDQDCARCELVEETIMRRTGNAGANYEIASDYTQSNDHNIQEITAL